MQFTFQNARIHAIATSLPPHIRTLEDDAPTLYDGDLKKVARIKKSIGLDRRHIADSHTTTLDLCFDACKQILSSPLLSTLPPSSTPLSTPPATTPASHIDGIIFVTQTPDFLQPNNSHLLHARLNLSSHCLCFDVNQGCSGYVYGLFLASMLIEQGATNILLCAGDTMSKVVHTSDSNTTPLFGDAGSATLITRATPQDSPHTTPKNPTTPIDPQNPTANPLASFFTLHADGKGAEFIHLPQSGFKTPPFFPKDYLHSHHLNMDGAEVFNFSIDKEPKAIQEILSYANSDISQIDYVFFHQANAYIISNIARRLDLPLSKAPLDSISRYGNTSSASIPLAICDHLANAKSKADLKLILSGFGVGLSWASALLTLPESAQIFPPHIYQGASS